MCYISGMSISKVKKILIAFPWIIVLISVAVLGLYEAGLITFRQKHKSPLTEVEFILPLIPLEDVTYSQNMLLINSEHPLPEEFSPDIVFYRDTDVPMNSAIVESYGCMSDYIREDLSDRLYVSSSYRSFEDQERIYNEEGPEVAALPGYSEHQTGLALDVYAMYFAGSAFPDCGVGQFVINNCAQFGFIIRYPYGAEDITGFSYEPWHIRYVGLPHSLIITEEGITLEEYIDLFEIGRWYSYEDYVIARLPEDDLRIPTELFEYEITVSPDNTGYVFVTVHITE